MVKKECFGCNKITYIYKNIEGRKYCKLCSFKLLPNTNKHIRKVSVKKQKQDNEYSKLRKLYLESHLFCEVKFPGICMGKATEIHHLYSGRDREKYYLDINTYKAICRNCHNMIHSNMSTEELLELGLKLID